MPTLVPQRVQPPPCPAPLSPRLMGVGGDAGCVADPGPCPSMDGIHTYDTEGRKPDVEGQGLHGP